MRRVKDVRIGPEGQRDAGKMFRITEMDADQAETWAMRALLALAKGGIDIGDAVSGGMQQLAVLGIQSLGKLSFEEVKPLWDDVMTCVTIVPEPSFPENTRTLVHNDIEEVATRIRLRAEVIALHTGFSIPGSSQKSQTTSNPGQQDSSSIRVVRRQPSSGSSYRQGKRR